MEKLFLSIAIGLLYFNSISVIAQKYAVFKSNGVSKNIIENKEILIKKGSLISEGSIYVVANDTLLLLDNTGRFYQLNSEKKYTFNDINKYEKQETSESLSKKYFSYVWNQMNNKDQTKNHTGNVYRDDLLNILLEPKDSVSINTNEITFKWEEDENKAFSYFFLKNNTNNTMTIIKINGNNLSLFTDNTLLVKGNSYSWAVAYEKYPSFNRIKFNNFLFLNELDYQTSLKEYNSVMDNLKKLGYSKSEVNTFICEYFNLCSN